MDSIDLRGYYYQELKNKKRVDMFVQQRAQRGAADCDAWDFYNFLGNIIVNGLRGLASDLQSYPDKFESIDNWRAILVQLINDFEEAIAQFDTTMDIQQSQSDLDDCFLRLSEIYRDLWD